VSEDSEHEKRVAAEIARINAEEAHKRMLYDRTIGGPRAPRPSVEFIRQSVGDLKTEAEMEREARETVEKQERREAIEREDRAAFERSVEAHKASIEREKGAEPGERSDEREGFPPLPPQLPDPPAQDSRDDGRTDSKGDDLTDPKDDPLTR